MSECKEATRHVWGVRQNLGMGVLLPSFLLSGYWERGRNQAKMAVTDPCVHTCHLWSFAQLASIFYSSFAMFCTIMVHWSTML